MEQVDVDEDDEHDTAYSANSVAQEYGKAVFKAYNLTWIFRAGQDRWQLEDLLASARRHWTRYSKWAQGARDDKGGYAGLRVAVKETYTAWLDLNYRPADENHVVLTKVLGRAAAYDYENVTGLADAWQSALRTVRVGACPTSLELRAAVRALLSFWMYGEDLLGLYPGRVQEETQKLYDGVFNEWKEFLA